MSRGCLGRPKLLRLENALDKLNSAARFHMPKLTNDAQCFHARTGQNFFKLSARPNRTILDFFCGIDRVHNFGALFRICHTLERFDLLNVNITHRGHAVWGSGRSLLTLCVNLNAQHGAGDAIPLCTGNFNQGYAIHEVVDSERTGVGLKSLCDNFQFLWHGLFSDELLNFEWLHVDKISRPIKFV